MPFQILPAIDLMDGGCVRLQQGDANRKTKYEIAPEEIARQYEAEGATRVHIVDLDGAFSGVPANLDSIKKIRAATTVELEVGGGLRTPQAIDALFNAGVNYAILGTSALEDETFTKNMLDAHGAKIIVGADARDGYLSTRGWTNDTQVKAIPFLTDLRKNAGLETVIFTDIARDGMFNAPNIDELLEVLAIDGLSVIASGGVGTADDVLDLQRLNIEKLVGVIVGKALYDGRIKLGEVIKQMRSMQPV